MTAQAYSTLTHNYASRSQGVHGAGARTFKPEQANRLLLILQNECVGPSNRKTVDELATRLGMNGRAVRDAISELEKERKVLTDFSEGYYVCETAEQAERATRRLESQIRHMQDRVVARRDMAANLDRLQAELF
jgi:DNA-binding transcriptional regulator YhcF (GntR family)